MKSIVLQIIAITVLGLGAISQSEARSLKRYEKLDCQRMFDRSNGHGIKGYAINIEFDLVKQTGTATLYPICPTCRVIPTVIELTDVTNEGMDRVYSDGDDFELRVHLESLLPTRTHPATFVGFGAGESFVCTYRN